MELLEAIRKTDQILDEERSSPTVRYSARLTNREDSVGQLMDGLAMLTETQRLQTIRTWRPRRIEENPNTWQFQSVNYDLLCALLARLPEDSRPALLSSTLSRLARPPGCVISKSAIAPCWNGLISEFPLIAEFCVRNGAREDFFRVLAETQPIQGHAVLLRHLEDLIALNFTVFSEEDFTRLATAITAVGYTARKGYQTHKSSGVRGPEAAQLLAFWGEIIAACDGIKEECRKARYLHLKGALLEGFNLEVNQDKTAVEHYLKAQGFSDSLVECLNRADQTYLTASNGFDFKSCMGHLRSFLEKLHLEGIQKRGLPVPVTANRKWGDGLKLLQEDGVISKTEEGYVSALFTLISDEGVHPVIAEKEYARLTRNVVIEYALLFLRKLEKSAPKRISANTKT